MYFPAKNKRSCIKGWQTLATTDQNQIALWNQQFPGCQWGMLAGRPSGMFIVDCDDMDSYAWFTSQFGFGSYIVQTKRGFHLYYPMPTDGRDIRNKQGVELIPGAPKLDIRGTGGLVITPGDTNPNYTVIHNTGDLVAAPDALIDILAFNPLVAANHTGKITPIDDNLREALEFRAPYCGDYDSWHRVGMALYHSCHGSDEAFEMWYEWSQIVDAGESDEAEHMDYFEQFNKWQSFQTVGDKITVQGEVYKKAFAEGYTGQQTNSTFDAIGGFKVPEAVEVLQLAQQQVAAEVAIVEQYASYSDEAKKITDKIKFITSVGAGDFPPPNIAIIDLILENTLYVDGSKYMFIDPVNGNMNNAALTDFPVFCKEYYGPLYESNISGDDLKDANKTAYGEIGKYIRTRRQRAELSLGTDMFLESPKIYLNKHDADISFNFNPLVAGNEPDNSSAIIEEYKQKVFPDLDNFLTSIVAARFSHNRKKAFTWIKCGSDWGKGFLTDRFKELGILVELSVDEVKQIMSGKPTGHGYNSFRDCWILMFNEFTHVDSNIKRLEDSITISPKNRACVEVETFTKLFISATTVETLIDPTTNAIEDQFANRFNMHECGGEISHCSAFSNPVHMGNVLRWYIATFINSQVGMYRDKPEDEARLLGYKTMEAYHDKYPIADITRGTKRLTDVVEEIAGGFKSWLWEHNNQDLSYSSLTVRLHLVNGMYAISGINKLLDYWLKHEYGDSGNGMFNGRKKDIIKALSCTNTDEMHHTTLNVDGVRILGRYLYITV